MPPAPPPIIPTAHRFLPTSSSRSKPTRTPRAQPQTPQLSSQQFAPTPRFSFAASKRRATLDHETNGSSEPGESSSPLIPGILRHRPRLLVRAKEKVEDLDSEHEEEDEPQKEESNGVDLEAEPENNVKHSTPPPSSPLPHHKRRRLKPPAPTDLDATILSSNPSPPPQLPLSHQRFLITPTRPPPPTTPLPKFLLPSPPSPPAPTALTFSPQRRAQKFVPGGLAASLRDLVVETALQGSRDAARAGRGGGARWDLRVRVSELRRATLGAGMVLVRGLDGGDDGSEGNGEEGEEGKRKSEEGEELGEDCEGKTEEGEGNGWMLIGQRTHGEVRRGCVIGIRRPVWEVEVLGERWRVGVEWTVLGS